MTHDSYGTWWKGSPQIVISGLNQGTQTENSDAVTTPIIAINVSLFSFRHHLSRVINDYLLFMLYNYYCMIQVVQLKSVKNAWRHKTTCEKGKARNASGQFWALFFEEFGKNYDAVNVDFRNYGKQMWKSRDQTNWRNVHLIMR